MGARGLVFAKRGSIAEEARELTLGPVLGHRDVHRSARCSRGAAVDDRPSSRQDPPHPSMSRTYQLLCVDCGELLGVGNIVGEEDEGETGPFHFSGWGISGARSGLAGPRSMA